MQPFGSICHEKYLCFQDLSYLDDTHLRQGPLLDERVLPEEGPLPAQLFLERDGRRVHRRQGPHLRLHVHHAADAVLERLEAPAL